MNQASIFKSDKGKKILLADYQENLNKWPCPYTTTIISTHYADTHVITCGRPEAPPLFILHGTGGNGSRFFSFIGEFVKHFRIYAPDIPGDFGKSILQLPIRTNVQYLQWFNQLLDQLNTNRIYILGFSTGGFLALHTALTLPHRVIKAAVYAPAGGISTLGYKYLYTLITCWLGSGNKKNIEKLISYSCAGIFPPEAWLVDQTHHTARFCRPKALLRIKRFSNKELASITLPILVMVGDKEVVYKPEKIRKRLNKVNPGIRFQLLPGAGHIPVEPEVFTAPALAFLLESGTDRRI